MYELCTLVKHIPQNIHMSNDYDCWYWFWKMLHIATKMPPEWYITYLCGINIKKKNVFRKKYVHKIINTKMKYTNA